jgi:hypothetical protein
MWCPRRLRERLIGGAVAKVLNHRTTHQTLRPPDARNSDPLSLTKMLTGKTQVRAPGKLVRKELDRISVLTENTPVSKYRYREHAILSFRFQNLGCSCSPLIY